ncbi:MAG: hypothetical protein HYZ20_06780 [Burkholderiales bacterium]|nr:hypothetical protein [Burkholderiales bacterium]
MRTTINLAEDAMLLAKSLAAREQIPLGEAASRLVRRGAMAPQPPDADRPLRGRFALLPGAARSSRRSMCAS